MRVTRLCSFLILMLSTRMVVAGGVDELANIDFSLRFPATMSRFSSYADVAGFGGASAGSRYSTSINPAAVDWSPSKDAPFSISPQLSRLSFNHARPMKVEVIAAGLSTEAFGTFQPAVARISQGANLSSDYLKINGDLVQLQWGKKLTENIAFGANANVANFNTKAGLGGMLVADSDSQSKGIRLGALWSVTRVLLAGIVIERTNGKDNSYIFNPGCLCYLRGTDSGRNSSGRVGVSYEYAGQSYIYADYMRGRFSNDTGSMTSNVLFLGIEHQFIPGVFGRAGFARDSRGFSGQTLGVGASFSKNTSIDLAIQKDMYPELRPEFGKSRLVNVSASFAF